ncbi:hypothetical protein [Rubellimicrobium sp. CFH 75288]|uniref:hypothetical protein n=1 Tax=Rubellimicrobium sp. CFH 75288 TaxID=2697034 RepID=UPI0014134800|nr:hypothetical protein [Rubellimicrobium sp. CFH 75288]NAZ35342.1 hypothetical protein [Rubellimicrobium sp. CFH 75288]
MDEQSPKELREAATAANLRRAFGQPTTDALPPVFGALLARLAAMQQGDGDRPANRTGAGGSTRRLAT